MTAKEKAEDIFNKMLSKNPSIQDGISMIDTIQAKQCALIAVNQIIEALETYDERTEKHLKREFPNYLSCELQNMEQDFRYYEQVKQEIEKL
jgi:hypothetical protein